MLERAESFMRNGAMMRDADKTAVPGTGGRINGVNLGGWLVLERWMTPGLFRASGEEDEIWLHRSTDPAELERLLRRHRDTYITEDDFHAISAHGLNLVRIPVPFFIFGDVPGHPGCVEYLDRAFDWAERAGLKVLIDLHTVPGSQNGFDNGGLTGVVRWHTTPRQVAFALDVLERLARRYRGRSVLYGIEVLNEPVDWFTYRTSPSSSRAKDPREARGSGHIPMRFLKRFYRAAYRRLRPVLGDGPVIVFHDGFRLNRWRDWFVREGMRGVVIDTHAYLVMSERPEALFRILPDAWLMRWYRLFAAWGARRIRRAARFTPVMVGEWCVANGLAARMGECGAQGEVASVDASGGAFDGYGAFGDGGADVGDNASGDGGSHAGDAGDGVPSPVARRRAVYRRVAAMQLDAWNVSAGQVYWSYRLRGGRGELDRLAPPVPGMGDGDAAVMDDTRLDPWDLRHVWHAGWMG